MKFGILVAVVGLCAPGTAAGGVVVPPVYSAAEGNIAFENYCGRTPAAFVETNGSHAILFSRTVPKRDNGQVKVDTQWGFRTKPFRVRAGYEYVACFSGAGRLPNRKLRVKLHWLAADGKGIPSVDALGRDTMLADDVFLPACRKDFSEARACTKGMVAANAVTAYFEVFVDTPDLKIGDTVLMSEIAYYECEKGAAWQFSDIDAPCLEMLTPSPNPDFNAPLRFRITDATGVDFKSLVIKIDHEEKPLEAFRRDGDVFTYVPDRPWEEDSLHSVDISVSDVNGYVGTDSGFVAFTRREVRHPKTKIRDDGVVLMDGKPFFPIGFCRTRPCDGNGNDVARGVREAKEGGLNTLHTYYVQRGGGLGGEEDLRIARQLADACNREGVLLFHEPAFRKPFISLERDRAIARTAIPWREEPCQWMWGIGDDTILNQTPDELRRTYRLMKAIDSDSILCSFDVMPDSNCQTAYAPWYDVCAVENYPFRAAKPDGTEIAYVARQIEDAWTGIQAAGVRNRSVIAGPQTFVGFRLWKRMPTKAELKCATFAALACRARGLMYYASTGAGCKVRNGLRTLATLDDPRTKREFFEIVADVKRVEKSLVLRDAARQPRAEILEGPKQDLLLRPGVRFLLKEDGLLIAANTTTNTLRVAFVLPSGRRIEHEFPRLGTLCIHMVDKPCAAGTAVPLNEARIRAAVARRIHPFYR